jgi:plastocyanin
MVRKFVAVGLAIAGLAISACGGRMTNENSMAGGTVMLPPMGDLAVYAMMPKRTIGEELPGEGLGQLKSVKWKAMLGGYTQQTYSESLGFPPGTKITIRNVSRKNTHTMDVVKVITKSPAIFPKNPQLSVGAKGDGKLLAGYASGPIKPGQSVTVTLVKDGIYLIGCAFHYSSGMHDVVVVGKYARPGPQATAAPTSSPTGRSSWDP